MKCGTIKGSNICDRYIILLVCLYFGLAEVNCDKQINQSTQNGLELVDPHPETTIGSTPPDTSYNSYDRSITADEFQYKTTLSEGGKKYLAHWNHSLHHFWTARKRKVDFVDTIRNNIDFGRIVGGSVIGISEVPYLVAVLYFNEDHCGGSLISLKHVLSAAHCFTNLVGNRMVVLSPRYYSIRHRSDYVNKGGIKISVIRIKVHPDYMNANKKGSSKVDLAVITLQRKVPQADRIPVQLPPSGFKLKKMEEEGARCLVAGWGDTKDDSPQPNRLRAVGVNLIKFDACKQIYNGYGIQPSKHVCCYSSMKDSCQGDSGGGLYYGDTILGVVSFGIGCAAVGIPGVYARVDSNLKFINRALSNAPRLAFTPQWGSLHPILKMAFIFISHRIVMLQLLNYF